MRQIKFSEAILEATDQCLASFDNSYLIGLGVPDPMGVFGTTKGLYKKYGKNKVMDMPLSENGMLGIVIGSSLVGMRPIMVHQRLDFFILALDQLINNASKWHYMFGSKQSVPIVIRLIVGKGWGQGPQHSQCLLSVFGHIPGIKVVLPSNAYDAKGLLISSLKDDDPVIFIEHRWLHNTISDVPNEMYDVPIGKAKVLRKGKDITIIAVSYMVLEALKAADILKEKFDIEAEVVDLRTIKPIDKQTIIESAKKTKNVIVVDQGWKSYGFASEIMAIVIESCQCKISRVALPDVPTPTSWFLANHYYKEAQDIVEETLKMLNLGKIKINNFLKMDNLIPRDVPDKSFLGPF